MAAALGQLMDQVDSTLIENWDPEEAHSQAQQGVVVTEVTVSLFQWSAAYVFLTGHLLLCILAIEIRVCSIS